MPRRKSTWHSLSASFAALALGLAAMGIYGLVAYYASQRTHELGVRAALGDERRDLITRIMKQRRQAGFHRTRRRLRRINCARACSAT